MQIDRSRIVDRILEVAVADGSPIMFAPEKKMWRWHCTTVSDFFLIGDPAAVFGVRISQRTIYIHVELSVVTVIVAVDGRRKPSLFAWLLSS